ncbi:MAG: hypothetical protein LBR70_01305 [Lactobacillaceae bacterium]|jgi:hypothetical protein|nr:hypothetical protein [Lactobacillaceae bacterium]
MTTLKKILFVALLVGLVPACGNKSEEIENFNEPRFTSEDPIELNVNKIEVVSEFSQTYKRPNVEHLFPISIEKTAKTWAADRLKAVDFSSDKKAVYIIKNASVTETLEISDKAFTKDRVKYKATLNVVLRVHDARQLSSAQTEIEAWRELTIPADTPLAEKEKYWNGMVYKLFDEFNARMEQNIRQYLNMYVKDNKVIKEYN